MLLFVKLFITSSTDDVSINIHDQYLRLTSEENVNTVYNPYFARICCCYGRQ